jgi:hypothetical protein
MTSGMTKETYPCPPGRGRAHRMTAATRSPVPAYSALGALLQHHAARSVGGIDRMMPLPASGVHLVYEINGQPG